MPLKMYSYKGCDTCRKAAKWLKEHEIKFEEVPIREQPPTEAELHQILKQYNGELRRLFNTSGGDYKELNLKDQLPKMSDDEAISLLSKNGNLVKRPFVVAGQKGLVGFKEDEWQALLG